MGGVLSIIQENCSQRFLPCERVNLDYGQFGEYQDSDQHPAERPFERPELPTAKKTVAEMPSDVPTILRYFLDGSRRTYKIADVIIDGRRFLPVVAGQIGVAVVERSDDGGQIKPLREFCHFENVIAFPDRISERDLIELERVVNNGSAVRFRMLQYEDRRSKETKDPVDLGVAKIMSEMADIEINAVRRMEDEERLNDRYGMLVIDGPLRFKKKFDLVQFRNVIGLSKSFQPTFVVGKGRKSIDVGSLTSSLKFHERTSVFKTTHENKTIGMWYVRIRPQDRTTNPLQGVVKIERYAVDTVDQEKGFDSARVDSLSSNLLRERNVTAYGSDARWASHIYPIYQAEAYLRASFLSDLHFKALF